MDEDDLYSDPPAHGFSSPALDLPPADLDEQLLIVGPRAEADEIERTAWVVARDVVEARGCARIGQEHVFFKLVAALDHARRARLTMHDGGQTSRRFCVEAWEHLRLLGGRKRPDLDRLMKWVCFGE